jgi:hypothetical protein
MQKWSELIAIAILLVVVIGAVFGGIHLLKTEDASAEISLPVTMIVGIVGLLLAIAAMVGVFKYFGLALQGEALGLPDGSVRAVIALSLVLLFAIVTIFLYGDLSKHAQIVSTPDLTDEQLATFKSHVPPTQIISTQSSPTDNKKTKVFYREVSNPASEDFAKQLLVLLGTLVTSVASFYFGTAAVTSAHDTTARALRSDSGEMKLSAVDPSSVKADGSTQKITIRGMNLANADGVMFSNGKDVVSANATMIKAENDRVICDVAFTTGHAPTAGTPGPKWDVIVNAGADVKKLRQALEITV